MFRPLFKGPRSRVPPLLLVLAVLVTSGCPGEQESREGARPARSEEAFDRAVVGGESRFVLPAGGARRFTLDVPEDAVLEVSFAVPDEVWDDGAERVEVTLWWEGQTDRRALVRRRVRKPKHPGFNRWRDIRRPMDVAERNGGRGELVLEAVALGSEGKRPVEIAWTVPELDDGKRGAGPNVILISIDTLRADRLGVYGYDRDTSPTVDRMASEGVVFRHAVSPSSWTLPSHASLFTGLHPSRHGAVVFGQDTPLARSFDTLAELFWRNGYATAGFVGGVFVAGEMGFDQGFDRYHDPGYMAVYPVPFARNVELAIDWMSSRLDRRFFVFLHSYQVHMPYEPPPPYDSMFDPDYDGPYSSAFTHDDYSQFRDSDALDAADLRHIQALYDGEIRNMDASMAVLLDFLARSGLRDNTCIVFTSDHGEEFKEHGNLFHHHAKLYEELLRIPMIVWCPSRIRGGREIDAPVSLTDVLPTLVDLAGIAAPDGIDGVSFYPALAGETLDGGRRAFAEVDASAEGKKSGRTAALRDGRYKLIDSTVPGYPPTALFDLVEDPGERRNLAEAKPEVANRLRDELLRTLRTSPETSESTPAPTPDAVARERLRALGYLND